MDDGVHGHGDRGEAVILLLENKRGVEAEPVQILHHHDDEHIVHEVQPLLKQ